MTRAVRALTARPGFTIATIAILAVGFGVNAAIFSMTRRVLLDPLPYRDADRLVLIGEASPSRGISYLGVVPANYADWRARVTTLEATAAWRVVYFGVSGPSRATSGGEMERPLRLQGVLAEPSFFPLLGVTPTLGRGFAADEGRPGRDRVVLLSQGFWRRQFGADPAVIGRQLTVDGTPCTVIGVLPDSFRFFRVLNRELDIWRPFVFDASDREHTISLYGKLRSGSSLEAARVELETAYAALPKEAFRDGWTSTVADLSTRFTANQRPILAALEAAVALVLCIAAANVATLMLAAAGSRRKETAMRVALGASWRQLALEFGREAAILCGAGAAAGLLLSIWAVDLLNRLVSYQDINRLDPFHVDGWVVAFTTSLAILCAVGFTLLPAHRIVDADTIDALKDSSHGTTRGVGNRRLRATLVVAELALSIVLLTGGLELARHALVLNGMSRGVDVERVMTAQLSLNGSVYDDPARLIRFSDAVMNHLRAAPGIAAASVVNYPPLAPIATSFPIAIEGRPEVPGREPLPLCWIVGTRYFDTVGIRMLAGRDFAAGDTTDRLGVAIASRTLALRFWGRTDVVGERLRVLFPDSDAFWIPRAVRRPLTIVGVVSDVREEGIGPRDTDPQLYLPYSQSPTRILTVVARTAGPPQTAVPLVRAAVRAGDPDQPTFDERTLDEVRQETFSKSRELAWIVGAFAAVALTLAVIGVYGVMSYLTVARRREIAIRLALGANRIDVVSLVVGDAMRLAAIAVALGVVIAPVVVKLAGLDALHAGTLAVVVAALTVACACAAAIPAYRASRTDEIGVIRS